MTESEIEQAALRFWELAGHSAPCPCRLESDAYYALPIVVTRISRLMLSHVSDWLREHNINVSLHADNRVLQACLIALNGSGFIFLNGLASEDESRYSFAHELAHFFLHYWLPRSKAIDYFGEGITAALDGKRLPTTGERVHALLSNLQLGCKVHLLSRSSFGIFGLPEIEEIEDSADRLALELLTPRSHVRAELRRVSPRPDRAKVVEVLVQRFGLPQSVAVPYSVLFTPKDTVKQWLGIS